MDPNEDDLNNSYSIYDHLNASAEPPDFSDFYNSYKMSNQPPDQSSASQQQKKKGRHIFSRIGQKSSSNNNLDLKGHVVVKVRMTPADIIKLGNNNSRIIPEEEAVCRFCFHKLFPVNNYHNNNVLMLKCLCPSTLTHEHCATKWYRTKGNTKCDVCYQNTISIPVTLSAPPCTSEIKPDKGFSTSTPEKRSCFRTG